MDNLNLIKNDALGCMWDPANFLIFSSEVEPLIYYSHIFPALAVLTLAFVIGKNNSSSFFAKIFIGITVSFSLFAFIDLILWATSDVSLIMFLWSVLTYVEPLIYVLTLYMVVVFAKQRDVSLVSKYVAATLFLPIFIFGPTSLNLVGFDYTNCRRLAEEGWLATYYVYGIEFIFTSWMVIASFLSYRKTSDRRHRKSILYLLAGSLLFLLAFSLGNIFGTFLQSVLGEDAWIIGQYGLFGMPIFLGFIMFLVVRFELFYTRIIYVEAIVSALSLVSLLLIPDTETARPIILVTLMLFSVLAFFLIRGIRNDLKQKEQIEKLADKLEKANTRLQMLDKQKSEFVSIASHQLRSPVAAIRGYSSLMLDGSYGNLTKKLVVPLKRISESAKNMTLSIEDYLNVSRIESGNMKYNLSDFNLADKVGHLTDDFRLQAIEKGIALIYRTDIKSKGVVNADEGKVIQVVQNLLNNSIKYTKKGSIKVLLRDDLKQKRIFVDVIDTGIGMSHKTVLTIFQKFERAENANSVNVSGAGLGLYVAVKMAEAMGGTVHAYSEGDDKGSKFTFELPLVM